MFYKGVKLQYRWNQSWNSIDQHKAYKYHKQNLYSLDLLLEMYIAQSYWIEKMKYRLSIHLSYRKFDNFYQHIPLASTLHYHCIVYKFHYESHNRYRIKVAIDIYHSYQHMIHWCIRRIWYNHLGWSFDSWLLKVWRDIDNLILNYSYPCICCTFQIYQLFDNLEEVECKAILACYSNKMVYT